MKTQKERLLKAIKDKKAKVINKKMIIIEMF